MEIFDVSSVFPEIYDKGSDEETMEALVAALKASHKSGLVEIPVYEEGWKVEDFFNRDRAIKYNLLALQGNVTVSLTKKGRGTNPRLVQLRVWVRNPSFWENGGHVDEYGAAGIFEAYGQFETLKSLAEKFLSPGRTRFENEHYIVWI